MAKRTVRSSQVALGVDLGGTKIAAGLFNERGGLHGKICIEPTQADKPRERTIESLFRAVEGALRHVPRGKSLLGIGIGSTGPLDPATCTILEAETLPRLFYYPIGKALEKRFGLPVRMTNDGNAFALAEARFGAARGHSIVVGITLGTGCGCGVVIEGRILEGATANTGEVYRAPVSGKCFDEVLSSRGLMACFAEATGRSAPGHEIYRLARKRDRSALRSYAEFGRRVAQGIGTIAAVLDPSVIVLGGSVAEGFEYFLPALRKDLPRYVAPQVVKHLRLRRSHLGSRAGALGGAALIYTSSTIR